jgi:hypothetical protein
MAESTSPKKQKREHSRVESSTGTSLTTDDPIVEDISEQESDGNGEFDLLLT